MCYSAVINQDYRYFVKRFGAVVDIHEFVRLFWTRRNNPKTLIPKAMEVAFSSPANEDEAKIKSLVDEFAASQMLRARARTVQAGQAPGRRRADAAGQDHQSCA
jgi:hypothetical protein